MRLLHVFFFFFQAEDGIRDYKVTGVQTCALPISARSGRLERGGDGGGARVSRRDGEVAARPGARGAAAPAAGLRAMNPMDRSEERRVGKECRSRGSPYH